MYHAKCMTARKIEPIGVAEIGALAGVSRQHVYNWIRRSKDMPRPAVRLACGPIWDADEIRKWLIGLGYTHLRRPKL
jgi:hypothetical protein